MAANIWLWRKYSNMLANYLAIQIPFFSWEVIWFLLIKAKFRQSFDKIRKKLGPHDTRNMRSYSASAATARWRLNESGLKCRRPCMRVLLQEQLMNARLAWVVAHERWYQPQWNSVLFFWRKQIHAVLCWWASENFTKRWWLLCRLWRWLCHGMGRDRY